jgi:hypothetical protein
MGHTVHLCAGDRGVAAACVNAPLLPVWDADRPKQFGLRNTWTEDVRDRACSRAKVVRCSAVLHRGAVSLRRLDRETLEELADDVFLWSLNIDLGARWDALVCRWGVKEVGLL